MSDQLAAAAKALNTPEAIVKRSAEARAKAAGMSVEEVLAAWAGGGTVAAPPAPATPAVAPAPPPEGPGAPLEAAPAAVQPAAVVQPMAAAPQGETPTPPPAPTRVSPAEAGNFPVVMTVPTAELIERTAPNVPRWLAAVSLLLSVFGLLYLAGNAQGVECGSGGVLAVDRQSGEIVNCDGSEFEGRGTPGSAVDFLTLGQSLYVGQAVSGVNCSGCHQPDGSGGNFPVLSGGSVLLTFSRCADHVEWVRLGSSGWPEPTYGDPGKRVGGSGSVMPSFGGSLSEEQLRSVVLFERVVFGGAPEIEAEVDCGLVETPPEGAAPAEGQAPVEGTPVGGETPSESSVPAEESTTTTSG